MVRFGAGLGDQILCTAVLRELRRRGQRDLWMASDHGELFLNSPDVDVVVPEEKKYFELAQMLKSPVPNISYTTYVLAGDRDIPPDRPIISLMCQKAGITGEIALRPYLYLSSAEKTTGRIVPNQIAIQTSGLGARYPMKNKEWYAERFQQVVDSLRSKFDFVQVGAASDPLMSGVHDLRGKTSIRETAVILSQSILMIGLVGGLMHLARAVDCRAVIIYGGRELSSQSGYICNENLASTMPCSPCWLRNDCEYERECMRMIDADAVLKAVIRQAERFGTLLPVQKDVIL